jgi:uncharacterized protein (TIGR03435 family)
MSLRSSGCAVWVIFFACCEPLAGQTGGQPVFEVASVKRLASGDGARKHPPLMRGGPGTSDPDRIRFSDVTLKDVLSRAYDLNRYEISGPSWTENETYDIEARLAPGTTRETFRVMLQLLLVDWFKLRTHWESREVTALVLKVGTGRSRLQESLTLEPAKRGEPAPRAASDREVGPSPRNEKSFFGEKTQSIFPVCVKAFAEFEAAGIVVFKARMATMEDLARELSRRVGQVVIDRTGLTVEYDFELAFLSDSSGLPENTQSASGMSDGRLSVPSLSAAAEEQLGLKLERTKLQIQCLVIDARSIVPSEN